MTIKWLVVIILIYRELELPGSIIARAEAEDYQVAGWAIGAETEETRNPREVGFNSSDNNDTIPSFQVKIGLIQNKIVLPTDAPINQQVNYYGFYNKVLLIINFLYAKCPPTAALNCNNYLHQAYINNE